MPCASSASCPLWSRFGRLTELSNVYSPSLPVFFWLTDIEAAEVWLLLGQPPPSAAAAAPPPPLHPLHPPRLFTKRRRPSDADD